MATVLHRFVDLKADQPDATKVRPSNWNDYHTVTGTFPAVTDSEFGAVGGGVTDDTDAFAAAAEAGQPVYVPPGTYLVGAIQPSSANGGFFGDGPTSIIKAKSNLSANLFTVLGRDNWSFHNLKIDMNNVLNHVGIQFQNCVNIDIDGVHVVNWDVFAIAVGLSDEWKIRNCIIKRASAVNTQNQGLLVYSVSQPTTRGLIADNIFENTAIDVSSSDTIIRNNIISNWKFGAGITTEQDTSCFNLQIIDNIIFGSTGTDVNGFVPSGIECWAKNSVIRGNICYNCAGNGIDSGGKNNVVDGNVCYDNGHTAPRSGIAARYGSATYNGSNTVISNNRCYDIGGGGQVYGYSEEAGGVTGIILSGNSFEGNATAPIKLTDLSATTVIDNCNAPNTQTGASYSVVASDRSIIADRAGTVTLTLLSAALYPSRQLTVKTVQAQTVVSASSNVVPLVGGAAGTAILAGTAGKWALLESDGTNWVIIAGN